VNQPRRPGHDGDILSEPAADRLLARASELDALRQSGATVAELRAAAVEAGISADAFNAALGEMNTPAAPAPPVNASPARRGRRWALVAALTTVILGSLTVGRMTPAASSQLVEESFVLNCLAAGDAAELIRPHLAQSGTVSISPEQSSRVLTVRATMEQIQTVRALLKMRDAAGSPACER
jgi:hypothetical protein